MIRVYKNNCDDFYNNGLGVLTDFKSSPEITEELNGCFELNFDYALKGKNSEYLVIDNIIKAPYDEKDQLFRIKRVKPSLKKLSIYAVHIFYDLSENFLPDVAPTKKSGVNATKWILDNAMFETKFDVFGDDIETNSARYIRKNIVEAILGADNSIVNRWNCELERDNYNIILHKERGEDRGVLIKEGKNIKEIEISIDFSTVVTRVVPQGANELLLPEYFIDSPLINMYRNPIVAKYEFDSIGTDEEIPKEELYKELRNATNALFIKDGIDKPSISVKVDWLELSKTEEYRSKYSDFERVRLGDTVTVNALGYNYKIRVIKIKYDCLLEQYTYFEIGDPKADYIKNQVNTISKEIQKNTSSLLEKAKETATTLINNGFGGNVRVYKDRIYIMDTDNEATAKHVWQWNLNGFAYSSTGINGTYKTGMTMDGQIVADFITTGTMSAERIEGFEEILQIVQQMQKLTDNVSGKGNVLLNSVIEFPAYELKIRNACQLFPSKKMYPNSNLYPLNRWLRVTYQDGTYNRYKLPILSLRELDGIYDELWIKTGKVSITKRIGMNEDESLYLLDEPITTEYDDINIEIKQGINEVKLEGFPNALLDIEYMIDNIYTKSFCSRAELNAMIDITKKDINIVISRKVGKDELISSINSSPEKIKIKSEKLDVDAIAEFTNSKLAESGSTVINGSNITTGVLQSKNYEKDKTGMAIDLDKGTIDSPNAKLSEDGDFEIGGYLKSSRGLLTNLQFASNGQFENYGLCGFKMYTGSAGIKYAQTDISIDFSIPENFEIVQAYITLYHTPIYWYEYSHGEFWGYARNLKLYKASLNRNYKFCMATASEYMTELPNYSLSLVENAFGSESYTASNKSDNTIETKQSINLKDIILKGNNKLVVRSDDSIPNDDYNCCLKTGACRAVIDIIGYMKIEQNLENEINLNEEVIDNEENTI